MRKEFLTVADKYLTGWFGRAHENGHDGRMTKHVHLVSNGGEVSELTHAHTGLKGKKRIAVGPTMEVLCGYVPHKTYQFVWTAGYAALSHVTCPKCLAKFKEEEKIYREKASTAVLVASAKILKQRRGMGIALAFQPLMSKEIPFNYFVGALTRNLQPTGAGEMGDVLADAIQKASRKKMDNRKPFEPPLEAGEVRVTSKKFLDDECQSSEKFFTCGDCQATCTDKIKGQRGYVGGKWTLINAPKCFVIKSADNREMQNKMVAAWALGEDTGVSSVSIAKMWLGMGEREAGMCPVDSDDFGRCYRLLKACPFIDIKIMAGKNHKHWDELVRQWDLLAHLYEKNEHDAVCVIIDLIRR